MQFKKKHYLCNKNLSKPTQAVTQKNTTLEFLPSSPTPNLWGKGRQWKLQQFSCLFGWGLIFFLCAATLRLSLFHLFSAPSTDLDHQLSPMYFMQLFRMKTSFCFKTGYGDQHFCTGKPLSIANTLIFPLGVCFRLHQNSCYFSKTMASTASTQQFLPVPSHAGRWREERKGCYNTVCLFCLAFFRLFKPKTKGEANN